LSAEDAPLAYRLLTGPDDRSFCERVSAALAEGYILHGGPALAFDGGRIVAAQAVVLPSFGSVGPVPARIDGAK
jgi:hypothetical protein